MINFTHNIHVHITDCFFYQDLLSSWGRTCQDNATKVRQSGNSKDHHSVGVEPAVAVSCDSNGYTTRSRSKSLQKIEGTKGIKDNTHAHSTRANKQ